MEEFFQDKYISFVLFGIRAAQHTLEVLLDAILFLAALITHESSWLVEQRSSVEEKRAVGVELNTENPVSHVPVVEVEHVATLLFVFPVGSVGREVRKFKVERELGGVLQLKMPVDFWLRVAELLCRQSGDHACFASEGCQVIVEFCAEF